MVDTYLNKYSRSIGGWGGDMLGNAGEYRGFEGTYLTLSEHENV